MLLQSYRKVLITLRQSGVVDKIKFKKGTVHMKNMHNVVSNYL